MKNKNFGPHRNTMLVFSKYLLIFSFLFFSSFLTLANGLTERNSLREKVYLHFDKPYYSSGEIIWFKAYIVEAGTNKPTTLSKIVYVDLISPTSDIVTSLVIQMDQGVGIGEFQLSTNLESGSYTIRSYTNYMRNFDDVYFFRKQVYIHNVKSEEKDSIYYTPENTIKEDDAKLNLKPDVQFFPEGGYMVNSVSSRVGFKAIGTNGKGISITGMIKDNMGLKTKEFTTSKFGLGMFGFTPESGKTYKAYITYRGVNYTYDLPLALDRGVVLMANNYKDDFKIYLQSLLAEGINNLVVTGKQGDEIVFRSELKGSQKFTKLIIPKKILTQGIVQFTIYDKNRLPLSERLMFVETNEMEPKISIVPDKEIYESRELIEVDISLNTQPQDSVQANMSVAITDVSVVQKESNSLNIKSYLLLNSELRGEIEQPGYYFESDDPKRKSILDLLMMCQGWRRYYWNEPENDSLKKFNFAIETGFSFKGTVKKFYNQKKTAITDVSLMTVNKNIVNNFEMRTDDHGRFEFGPYWIPDSTTVIIQARNIKLKDEKNQKKHKNLTNNYSIILDLIKVPTITAKINTTMPINEPVYESYVSRSKQEYHRKTAFETSIERELLDTVELKPVKIKTEIEIIKEKKRYLVKEPSNSLSFQDLPYIPSNPLDALQGRIPGVFLQGDSVYLRSTGLPPATVLLDGMPIKNENIEFLNGAEIDFIDIIKPPRSYIYGAIGNGGIVAIYSKDAETEILLAGEKSKEQKQPEIMRFIHPGFHQAKEFYKPVYTIEKQESDIPDYRSTLYWNPRVKFDKEGHAKISFYGSYLPTTFRVELEGLTSDGIPFIKGTFIGLGKTK